MLPPNTQEQEYQVAPGEDQLAVHSMFYTIQGEGPFAGRPALFVRLAGCNLQCPLCDTDYTSKREIHSYRYFVEAVMDRLGRYVESFPRAYASRPLVVLTGGEPLRQNVGPFVLELLEQGIQVQVETNGTYELWSRELVRATGYGKNFSIVCSPKARVKQALWPFINAVKYVLHADHVDPTDGLPITALSHPVAKRVSRPPLGWDGSIYVQPVDVQDPDENRRHTEAAIMSCMRHGYIMCLQTHKILGLE